jgi:hypothetical protein
MAKGRRYVRDNRGRFASVGATARGGRLKTAAGNKRATVTATAKGGGNGTVSKPKGLKPGAIKPKPQSNPAPVAKAKIKLPRTSGTVAKPKELQPGTIRPKATPPTVKATRASRGAAKPKPTGPRRKVDVQIQRAKPGGQFGPDGHWYAGGAWMSQGKFIGGKPVGAGGSAARSSEQKKGGSSDSVKVIKNRAPAPRPLAPSGTGLPAQPKMNKTAQKLNDEFFGGSGFLSSGMDKAFRQSNGRGRAPIDNTRYIGALASRLSEKELRSRTAAAIKGMSKESRRGYIRQIQDARRDLPFMSSALPRAGVSQKQIMNAIRFDSAAREISGQRGLRGRRNGRSPNEEYAWVTNAMLMQSRRRR